MSVFGSIKDFLFGKKFVSFRKPGTAQAASVATVSNVAPAQPSVVAPATPQSAPVTEQVDIAGILDQEAMELDQEAMESGQTLNWRQSIVDLMKLCGLDSSLENRKALAHELGYTGTTDDSASMNIWLHKQVLQKLAENGGLVPAELKD